MVFAQVCVRIGVFFSSKCVLDWCKCATDGVSVREWLCTSFTARLKTQTHTHTCIYFWTPSLGRRQSQPWGCSSAALAASQANLGGENHFDLACKSEGPQREVANPCNLYWIYSFSISRPHAPHREEVSIALTLSPKTICYDTHMSTHNGVNTHRQPHTQRCA